MNRWPEVARTKWFGLAAAALAIVGAGIAMASTNRHTVPVNPAAGYSKQ